MKKTMFAAVAVLAATMGAAWAGTIENGFGNTIIVQSGEVTVSYRFEPNNTYVMTAPDGTAVPGRWAVNGEQICLTPTGGAAECHPYDAGHNVGETWTTTNPDGTTATITIRRGR